MSVQPTLIPELSQVQPQRMPTVRSFPMENLMLDQCLRILSLVVHDRPGLCTSEIESEFHAVTGLKPCFGWIADLVESRQVPGVAILREGRFKRFYPMPTHCQSQANAHV